MFQATYYNGLSSFGHPATVELKEDSLLVSYKANHDEIFVLEWNVSLIKKNDINSLHKVILVFGTFPHQSLEITDPLFYKTYQQKFQQNSKIAQIYQVVIQKSHKMVVYMAIFLVAMICFLYFIAVPFLAEQLAQTISKDYEKKLGEHFYNGFVLRSTINTKKTKAANEYFKKLNFKTGYEIKITVLENSQVNAFALPGGRIVIFSGILEKMKSHEELAALISHELTHIENKHSTKALCRSLSNYMLISVISGDVGGISAVMLENANLLQNLNYSRLLEQEADQNGLELMFKRKLNPQGMVDLFKQMEQTRKDENKYLKFLQSHPLTEERIQYIQEKIINSKYTVQKDSVLNKIAINLIQK